MCCICLYCRYVELIFMIESCDVLWDDVDDVCGRASLSCTDRKLDVFGLCDCGLRAEVDIFTVWILDITFSEGLTALLAWCVVVFSVSFALPLILRQRRRLNRPHVSSDGRFNLVRPQISFWFTCKSWIWDNIWSSISGLFGEKKKCFESPKRLAEMSESSPCVQLRFFLS